MDHNVNTIKYRYTKLRKAAFPSNATHATYAQRNGRNIAMDGNPA